MSTQIGEKNNIPHCMTYLKMHNDYPICTINLRLLLALTPWALAFQTKAVPIISYK